MFILVHLTLKTTPMFLCVIKKSCFLKVRDEKAELNRQVDRLSEKLINCTSQLEELAARLKEFEEGKQAVDRRLEAAKHQIEVQEALGPQVLQYTDHELSHIYYSHLYVNNLIYEDQTKQELQKSK